MCAANKNTHNRIQIIVAVIGAAGVIIAAIIGLHTNKEKVVEVKKEHTSNGKVEDTTNNEQYLDTVVREVSKPRVREVFMLTKRGLNTDCIDIDGDEASYICETSLNAYVSGNLKLNGPFEVSAVLSYSIGWSGIMIAEEDYFDKYKAREIDDGKMEGLFGVEQNRSNNVWRIGKGNNRRFVYEEVYLSESQASSGSRYSIKRSEGGLVQVFKDNRKIFPLRDQQEINMPGPVIVVLYLQGPDAKVSGVKVICNQCFSR